MASPTAQLAEILVWLKGVTPSLEEGALTREQVRLVRDMGVWIRHFSQRWGGLQNVEPQYIAVLYEQYRQISQEFYARTARRQLLAQLDTVNQRTRLFNGFQNNPQYLDPQTNPNEFNNDPFARGPDDPNDEQLGMLRDFLANNQTQRGGGGYM